MAAANMIRDMKRIGFRPYLSLDEPHNTEPSPIPIIAMEMPIWVMEGVVWNSFIIEGIVGRYMSLTREEKAPIIAINAMNKP